MTYLDLHILQTVPPSNLNRDDTGSPKTATFGGVRRARVSSQAWKRATRTAFKGHVDESELGYRTTRLVDLVARQIRAIDDAATGESEQLATTVVEAVGLKTKPARKKAKDDMPIEAPRTEYLTFLSAQQVEQLARLALESRGGSVDKKLARQAADTNHSIDVALFGRMVANDATLNVDAAVQVAHALSTHAVEPEFDYYTAVDDQNPEEETGAGMIGTIEFNSATLYRFATINVEALVSNLGSRAAANAAISAFVQAFITSMPTGKQNTFGNRTLPDAVVAIVREDQPVSLVGAFEDPVTGDEGGFVAESGRRLRKYAEGLDAAYGMTPRRTLVLAGPVCAESLTGLGENVTMSELAEAVGVLAGSDT